MRKLLILFLGMILSYYYYKPLLPFFLILLFMVIPIAFIKKIYGFLKQTASKTSPVDKKNKVETDTWLEKIDDSLIKNISWSPCAVDNNYIEIRSKHISDTNILKYILNSKTKITFVNIILISFALAFLIIYYDQPKITLGIPIVLTLAIVMIYSLTKSPMTFDKLNGKFSFKSHQINLNDIYAIQLIPKIIYRRKRRGGKIKLFELNLVLNNHSRLNIESHPNYSSIRQQAQEISMFLDIPFWDKEKMMS